MLRFFGKGKALRAPISRTKAQHFFPKIGWGGGGSEAVWKFSENSSNMVQIVAPYRQKCVREDPLTFTQKTFGHCPNGGGLNACPDGLLRQLRHLKKVPHSARLSVERGVQKLIGQCPNAFCANVRPPESVRIYLPAELSGGLQLKKTPCR